MYQSLQGRIAGLEVIDVLLIDAFATMIRIGIVDAFGTIDRGARSAAWCVSIALGDRTLRQSVPANVLLPGEVRDTLDFLLRHAIQAVLTHLLFAEAGAGEPLSTLRDLDLLIDFGPDSAAVSRPFGVPKSGSSTLGSFDISSEMQSRYEMICPNDVRTCGW